MQSVLAQGFPLHKKKDTKLANLMYYRIKTQLIFPQLRGIAIPPIEASIVITWKVESLRENLHLCLESLSAGQVFINFHFPGLILVLGEQTGICFTMHFFLPTLQIISFAFWWSNPVKATVGSLMVTSLKFLHPILLASSKETAFLVTYYQTIS